MELETQLAIAEELQYLTESRLALLQEEATNVGRALSGLIKAMQRTDSRSRTTDDERRTA